jgi:hypothetical protein
MNGPKLLLPLYVFMAWTGATFFLLLKICDVRAVPNEENCNKASRARPVFPKRNAETRRINVHLLPQACCAVGKGLSCINSN